LATRDHAKPVRGVDHGNQDDQRDNERLAQAAGQAEVGTIVPKP
jgi:hypothetical protein